MSHADDDTGILNGAGAPTVLNAPATGVVWPRTPAQVRTEAGCTLVTRPCSWPHRETHNVLALVHVAVIAACRIEQTMLWRHAMPGLLNLPAATARANFAALVVAQIIQITTLANPEGVGGFFPTGYQGTVNGTRGSVGSSQNLPQ